MSEKKWNPEQQKAISAFGGNILVSAAAGSGKTAVLVERVIQMLTREENPVDADRLLVVTFTELAASEMKSRINSALSELYAKNPDDERLSRQMLLMEKVHISTIHAFCLDVIVRNFNLVGIAPDSRIMDEFESGTYISEALEEALEEAYKSGDAEFAELSELLGAGRSDSKLEKAVTTVYKFIRAIPHYEDWIAEKEKLCDDTAKPLETPWGRVLMEYALDTLKNSRSKAESLAAFCEDADNENYAAMARDDAFLLGTLERSAKSESWDSFGNKLTKSNFIKMPPLRGIDEDLRTYVKNAREDYKDPVQKKLAEIFRATEADFSEDIKRTKPQIKRLFELVLDFDRRYSEIKREKRLLDFSDMEQFVLKIFSEKDGFGNYVPTKTAKEISSEFDYILVDECQDINRAQSTIFDMISRGDNLFFVGDVKQSIYRFRQARPELFMEKRRNWKAFDGKNYPATIILGRNYRSRKNIAGAVNYIFSEIMSEKAAEMDYTAEEMLIPEATYPESDEVRNEAVLIDPNGENKVVAEAETVAEYIKTMVKEKRQVTENGVLRPMRYGDICILLRAMKDRAEFYVSALAKRGIICRTEKSTGFLNQPEVEAVLNLLKAADNPYLDIPLAGAMLSEIFGFTAGELAEMRLENRKEPLFLSVKRAAEKGDIKAARLMEIISEIRSAAAAKPSDMVIERLYELTMYPQMMAGAEGGDLRVSNLRLLIKYAAERERSGWHGLSGFLRFIARFEESGSDLPAAEHTGFSGDAVRIMTVHGSKGLEFPVVFISDTGKKFKFDDRSDEVMINSELGVTLPARENGFRYTTVPQYAMKLMLKKAAIAEEMRILYVAATRAKENLIITCADSDPEKFLAHCGSSVCENGVLDPFYVSSVSRESEWIFASLLRHPDGKALRTLGGFDESIVCADESSAKWNIRAVKYVPTAEEEESSEQENSDEHVPADEKVKSVLKERAGWSYPYSAAEKIPVKAGVSSLTHGFMHKKLLFSAVPMKAELSGAERGTALHTFMQFCDFSLAELSAKKEIERLTEKKFITEKQASAIDPAKVESFFKSRIYAQIKASGFVKRELRFVQSLPAKELGYSDASDDDRITVQGVADCVFEHGGRLYVLDYKTDFVDDIEELRVRYAEQLIMYKKLLTASLGREVAGAVIWSFRFGKELWI